MGIALEGIAFGNGEFNSPQVSIVSGVYLFHFLSSRFYPFPVSLTSGLKRFFSTSLCLEKIKKNSPFSLLSPSLLISQRLTRLSSLAMSTSRLAPPYKLTSCFKWQLIVCRLNNPKVSDRGHSRRVVGRPQKCNADIYGIYQCQHPVVSLPL